MYGFLSHHSFVDGHWVVSTAGLNRLEVVHSVQQRQLLGPSLFFQQREGAALGRGLPASLSGFADG